MTSYLDLLRNWPKRSQSTRRPPSNCHGPALRPLPNRHVMSVPQRLRTPSLALVGNGGHNHCVTAHDERRRQQTTLCQCVVSRARSIHGAHHASNPINRKSRVRRSIEWQCEKAILVEGRGRKLQMSPARLWCRSSCPFLSPRVQTASSSSTYTDCVATQCG
jgi:hypothetical protein